MPKPSSCGFAGRLFYVLHDLNALEIDPVDAGVDVIVSGHSHAPKINNVDGLLNVNPGSAGRRLFRLQPRLAAAKNTN
ncbi:metallophosphoesterase family protein [Bradyrhizobium sp. 15]|uniref:metallophosphoesterase family protein n=1 Tax=unclassified Bradyrhizobium TaxID=2631580 RepID=UPI00320B3CB4